jgi:hypothetical protein
MDDLVKTSTLRIAETGKPPVEKPSREEAMAAVRTLLRWAGEDPTREGLLDTPKRVVKAYEEFFAGYRESPDDVLDKVFREVDGYDDMVLVRDIPFASHCEHHMVPFVGKAHIAYYRRWRCGPLEARAIGRHIRQAFADAGDDDGADHQRHERGAEPAWRRGLCRGRAHVHVDARRAEAWLVDDHDAVFGRVPGRSGRAGAVLPDGAFEGVALTGPLASLENARHVDAINPLRPARPQGSA